MIDATLRRYIDPPLDRVAAIIATGPITANRITASGFVLGLLAVPALAAQRYDLALVAILVNRISDGLDGAVARRTNITDFGGYLDIVLDFIFYSAVVFGFALAQPEYAVHAAFLIFSFIGSGSSFLAYSIFAARRRITTRIRGRKSIYYLGGLTEGFETIVAFVFMCLVPAWFWLIAVVFGIMCWMTTASRIAWAYRTLRDPWPGALTRGQEPLE